MARLAASEKEVEFSKALRKARLAVDFKILESSAEHLQAHRQYFEVG